MTNDKHSSGAHSEPGSEPRPDSQNDSQTDSKADSPTSAEKVDTKPAAAKKAKAKPVKAEKAQKVARTGPHPLSWINLVLMLGVFAVAAYAGFLGWQQQQATNGELAVLRDRLDQAQQKADAASARQQQFLSQAQSLSQTASNLKEQVAHNSDRLGKLPGAERQDWLLAETEYLLRLANQRLQLERDWDGALSMLQAADNVLVETRNPRMNPVRADIAREILALRAVPAIDTTGAIHRLQAMQEQVVNLPWLPEKLVITPDQIKVELTPEQESLPMYEQLWLKVSKSVLKMVRFRQRDEPIAAPLTPDQQYYLQQNMRLMLEQAQIALLRNQTEIYQHSLTRVSNWLDQYLMIDDERTRAARSALTELQNWDVDPQVPDISASLLKLQKLVEQQRRGTVNAKAAAVEGVQGAAS